MDIDDAADHQEGSRAHRRKPSQDRSSPVVDQVEGSSPASSSSSEDARVQDVRDRVTRLGVNDNVRRRKSGGDLEKVPRPYGVVYDGPIPRTVADIDTAENQHRRNYCARLFNGEVKFGRDADGLLECMLIDLPDLFPLDREKVLAFKASEQKRIREGKPPIEYESDEDGETDEEKRQRVECCTPADLDGMEVGRLRTYEDGYVEYVCGGIAFEVTEGTDVIDRQDIYVALEEKSIDSAGQECDMTIYPMMTVKHRVTFAPRIDDLL
jgi:hypothetical protein